MNKRILQTLLLFSLLIMAGTSNAQVTIGSGIAPSRAALLDIKEKQAQNPTNVGDTESATTGGVLLPRVALKSTITLEPFVPITDADWDGAAKQKQLSLSIVGLMVYNIATVGSSLYPGLYTWDGEKWATSQANPSAGMEIAVQPQSFTFYETGTETVQPLIFTISGATGVTYQWYQVTGSNVHVRVGTPIGASGTITGTGATTITFTPTGVIKGTTHDAHNTGFYKFYCEATDSYGKKLHSETAEVAVGCGAKNNAGEWISFMCFNLGAQNGITIEGQKNYPIGIFTNNTTTFPDRHDYIPGEENAWGDMFQWGRIADGHENRQSGNLAFGDISTVIDIANGKQCSVADDPRPYQQISKASTRYGKFIYGNGIWNPADQGAVDFLWRTGRFVQNDPCAHYRVDGTYQEFWYEGTNHSTEGTTACTDSNTGWRIPSQDEWGNLYKGGTISGSPTTATANTWMWYNGTATNYSRGYEIMPDGATTTLFLPASGLRNNGGGALYSQGSTGYYWSANFVGTGGAYELTFNGSQVYPAYSLARSNGLAVRCIKNQ